MYSTFCAINMLQIRGSLTCSFFTVSHGFLQFSQEIEVVPCGQTFSQMGVRMSCGEQPFKDNVLFFICCLINCSFEQAL